jgi:hypothetical protein
VRLVDRFLARITNRRTERGPVGLWAEGEHMRTVPERVTGHEPRRWLLLVDSDPNM